MRELALSGDLAVDPASAFDASPNPYVLVTPDLRIAGLNQAYLNVTHSTREAIVGKPLFAAFDSGPGEEAPENVRQVRASIEKARDTRQPDHLDAYAQLIGHRDIAGKPIREALPEIEGQGYFEFLDGVYETGEPFEGRASLVQLQRTPGAPLESRYLNFIYQPIRDANGAVAGIFVQGHDVTETVRSAERQKLMIDELNHRVKNTLATIQSIAMQTARSHADPATFAESFQARLLALSHTHDLLTRSHWESADLDAILRHETEAHGSHRVSLNGPPVALEPAAAVSWGMIFHELATNAAKYGALSAPEGRVLVDWAVANQIRPELSLTWREIGGPPVSAPERRGFGSRLIERNVRHDLAGEVKLAYASDGFSAEFRVPLQRDGSS